MCASAFSANVNSTGPDTDKSYLCKHSQEVYNTNSSSTPVELNEYVLDSCYFPPDVKTQLLYILSNTKSIIQRVSHQSFVMRKEKQNFPHPLRLVHVRIEAQGKIRCQCSHYKTTSSLTAVHTSLRLSKCCIHVYGCLWARLSSPEMQVDFPMKFQQDSAGLHWILLQL